MTRDLPWYDLPPQFPSHQTVYRRYRQWRWTVLLDAIRSSLLQRFFYSKIPPCTKRGVWVVMPPTWGHHYPRILWMGRLPVYLKVMLMFSIHFSF